MSQTMAAEKIVSTDMYRQQTCTQAKKQKLLRASSDVNPPKKKARALVNEVMVMDGPAWERPTTNLLSAGRWSGVWSIVFTTTNMSSTPIPNSMKGKILCTVVINCPIPKQTPAPAVIEILTQRSPIDAKKHLQWIGLQFPSIR